MYKYKNNVGANLFARASKARQNKGITLIALVITIIVMLILVAVTISMAVNGGLFDYAGKATGEMQNAIDLEQQLADGKIKIDGKWYASIDDYLNNKPIIKGIEITPAEITLKKKEAADVEGEEVLTGTITASVFGMGDEPEITWGVTPADQTAITLSSTTGKSITVTAVGTEKATVTLTAKCTYEGEEYTEAREVKLEILKRPIEIAIGDFVQYDVEYTDVYNNKTYENTFGWRLLNYEMDANGNLYDVELISTGVPAMLNYSSTYSYNPEGKNKWWVTDANKITAFKTALENYYEKETSSYTFYSNAEKNVYATAGMHDNFENILFYTESNYNAMTTANEKYSMGYYKSVIKNGTEVTTDTVGSELFLTSDDYSVRTLTLPEINNDRSANNTITSITTISSTDEPAAGLYVLQNIKNTGLSTYAYSSGYYWLASPDASDGYSVFRVSYQGQIVDHYNIAFGVRPVVKLESNITYSVDSHADETTGVTYLILTPEV